MIFRDISNKVVQLTKQFPVVAIIGPRQSGKTTLVKNLFPDFTYVNLEEPDTRQYAQQDPRDFLSDKTNGLIIDEAQKVPELFSYIQTISDSSKKNGQFILTGSQNFLLLEKITQTLAGRVAILTLLPFALSELNPQSDTEPFSKYLFNGFYPPIYDRNLSPLDWFPNYISTYIERDVRQIKNISDLSAFNTFVKLCAGRIGQLLNISSLANETGISINTAKSWLSILESSFIIFKLQPHFHNYNKRLVKMPKLYFYDTGLACSLLNISTEEQVSTHYNLGALFENMIISELLKFRFNRGLVNNLYFWRDKLGKEIDCLIDNGNDKITVEIKAGKTLTTYFFKDLAFYNKLTTNEDIRAFLIYGGDSVQRRGDFSVLPWFKATDIFN